MAVKYEVASVTRPIVAVNRIVDSGQVVYFSRDGCYVADHDGATFEARNKLELIKKGGLYFIKA
eukprot:3309533-Alexandrium_andersonii.AAC.1